MRTSTRLHHYELHGLALRSELALPLPETTSSQSRGAPVEVVLGTVDALANPVESGPDWTAVADAVVFDRPGFGRARIEHGRITMCPDGRAEIVRHVAVHAVVPMAALFVPGVLLHGSLVTRYGRSVVLCAVSGTGKSTLATALVQRGVDMHEEDVVVLDALTLAPRCGPARAPAVRLRGDVLRVLGQQPADLLYVSGRRPKHVATLRPPATAPARLERVCLLERGVENRLTPLPGAVRGASLAQSLFRPRLQSFLRGHAAVLAGVERVTRRLPVHRLEIRDDLSAVHEAAAHVDRLLWDGHR